MSRAALAVALARAMSGVAWAQAEPAPEDYVPPAKRGQPTKNENENANESANGNGNANGNANGRTRAKEESPRWNLAVAPRLSILVGDSAAGIPNVGYGAAVRLHFSFLPLGPLRVGVGLQFAFDRFAREKPAMLIDGVLRGPVTQSLSHASFAALALLDGMFGRVRPWVGLGGGFSVASYSDPPLVAQSPETPYSVVSVVPMVTVAFGVGVRLFEGFELGLRGDLDLTFSSQAGGMPPRALFAPGVFGLSLDLGFRF